MSALSCKQVRADLSAYLDGDLDGDLTDAIRAHLDGCAACRSELDLLRLTVGALRRLPDLPPPAAILSGIRARLQPEPWYRRLLGGRPWFLGVPVGALATVLVVVGIALFQARYPDMSKTVTQGPFPQSHAPEMQAKPSTIAPSSPAVRDMGANRQAVAPPASPARGDLRAKGTLGSATLPQSASGSGEVNAPESSAVAGADARDSDRATMAAPATPVTPVEPVEPVKSVKPAEPAALTEPAAVEPKVEMSQPAQPELPVAAPKNVLGEETQLGDNLAAAPFGNVIPKPEPATERTVKVDEYSARETFRSRTPPDRSPAVFDNIDGESGAKTPPLAKKMESREVFERKTDSGSSLGYARLAEKKEKKTPTWIEFICLLSPAGDTLEDLERLLRREGAGGIVISVLEPPAVREAFAPHRGRLSSLPVPSQGWTVTASIPPRAITRLPDVLTRRTGLKILEQPAAPPAPEDTAELLDLRITVLR